MEQICCIKDEEPLIKTKVVVVNVPKKDCSRLMSFASVEYPLEELSFLKRARNNPGNHDAIQFIIAKASRVSEEEVTRKLEENMFILNDRTITTDVPTIPPRTKEEFHSWKTIWPLNFHPDVDR